MDCEQIKELLDAYALGAAEQHEAAALEEHVADCVRCWSSLNEAQRLAASLALSTALHQAPESLRRSILAEVERTERPAGTTLIERLRRLWPIGAGVLAAAAAASLAFAIFLQMQVSDLRDDNSELAAEIESADVRLTQQQQLIAVLAAPDVQHIDLEPTDGTSSAVAVYHWSERAGTGALTCNNLPALQQGQVYQVWVLTEDGTYRVGSFETWDGIGQLSMDLDDIPKRPAAIGVSVEQTPDADEPGDMFLIARFR